MAFNDSDNNDKKYREPLVYSPYGTSNTDGVDPSALSYTFTLGMLKISIAPMKPGAKPDDKYIWDHDNAVSVWLTHLKAQMLCDEIQYALAHPDEINNGGVSTGKDGLIAFSNGKEFGASGPCLSIRKIDPNTGAVQSVYAYQFKDNYHYAIRNFDPQDPMNYEKVFYPQIEIHNLITILKDYARSASGAYAYANMNCGKYDSNRMGTKIDLIMDKLGIEKPEYSNRGGAKNSFFNNNQGSQASSAGESFSSGETQFMNSPTMEGLM